MIPYDRYGVVNPDFEWLPLSGNKGGEYECFFIRFKPGARSTPHVHTGGEDFMVLEGELEDCDGTVFKPGDFVCFAPGSKHWSYSADGCLLLAILRGGNRQLETNQATTHARKKTGI